MKSKSCLTIVVIVFFITVMMCGHAMAGMVSPCAAPSMFPDSDVTVFVLPYVDETSEESSRIESPVGTGLAGLIQADTLLSISRFGRVAAIRMMGRPDECQPDLILKDLLGSFGSGRSERAIVMMWGRIFHVGTDIYLQSSASFGRFVRNDPGEMLQLPFGDRQLAAKLATQSLTFPPRHVSEQDLQNVRERFAQANIVHQKPDESSPGKPLLMLFPQERRPAYYMTDSQGDWIRIHTQTGQDGWILARAMIGQQSLSARLPEMKFVEGVAGYFGFRAQPSTTKSELTDAAFRTFEDSSSPSSAAATAVAVSKALRGMVQLLASKQSNDAFTRSSWLFTEAAEVITSNSETKNMAAVVSLYRDWKQPGARINFQQHANQFWSSISADPYDAIALTNCWTMFVVARNPGFRDRFTFDPPLSDEELAQEAKRMEELQLKGKQVTLAHGAPIVAWPTP